MPLAFTFSGCFRSDFQEEVNFQDDCEVVALDVEFHELGFTFIYISVVILQTSYYSLNNKRKSTNFTCLWTGSFYITLFFMCIGR